MECYYHPEREGENKCAICGKSICKECGLEIAGKTYCKECLEKIVGLSLNNNAQQSESVAAQEPIDESIYQPQQESEMEIPYTPQDQIPQSEEYGISEDSPYNIKDNIVSSELEQSNLKEDVKPQTEQPQVAQNEFDYEPEKQVLTPQPGAKDDFIYPDHSYEPAPTSARQELEDKYEKYLDDLYFDDTVPLNEQLAKDEEQYGSLTRKEYKPRKEDVAPQEVKEPGAPKPKKAPINETPEEMEARIRAEILNEQKGKGEGKSIRKSIKGETNIHNINYKDEKEPMGALDIILTIILIIVILVVVYYLLYLFILHATYPNFMDAVYALQNPQNVINNLLTNK